jgi:hypothetical protein
MPSAELGSFPWWFSGVSIRGESMCRMLAAADVQYLLRGIGPGPKMQTSPRQHTSNWVDPCEVLCVELGSSHTRYLASPSRGNQCSESQKQQICLLWASGPPSERQYLLTSSITKYWVDPCGVWSTKLGSSHCGSLGPNRCATCQEQQICLLGALGVRGAQCSSN